MLLACHFCWANLYLASRYSTVLQGLTPKTPFHKIDQYPVTLRKTHTCLAYCSTSKRWERRQRLLVHNTELAPIRCPYWKRADIQQIHLVSRPLTAVVLTPLDPVVLPVYDWKYRFCTGCPIQPVKTKDSCSSGSFTYWPLASLRKCCLWVYRSYCLFPLNITRPSITISNFLSSTKPLGSNDASGRKA